MNDLFVRETSPRKQFTFNREISYHLNTLFEATEH